MGHQDRLGGLTLKRIYMIAGLIVSCASCAPSGFNGSTGVAKKDSAEAKPAGKPKPPVSPGTPIPSGTIEPQTVLPTSPVPGKCTDAGTTVAKLLTTSGITNGASNQFLEYELSMEDCEGVVTPITARVILFDLDAESESPRPLPYQVKSQDGLMLSSGVLQTINGSDLFGVIGLNRFHHRTNNNIDVPSAHRKIKLSIDLSNTVHQPMGSGDTVSPQALISTFLRFGDAAPVKMPVPFVNPI